MERNQTNSIRPFLIGGGRPPDPALAKGAYLQPTVLEAADNSLRVAQEEIFGPVACVLRFRDEEDLVRQANDIVFGLACAVWPRDYKRAFRIGKHIKAGTIWINTYKLTMVNMPFGGYKSSGLWRECGIQGMKYYMAQKSVYLNLDENSIPWSPITSQ